MDSPSITNQSHEAAVPLPLLDFFFPGFSIFSGAVQKYLHIDLNMYIPLVLLFGGMIFAWRYFSEYFWGQVESHFMSTVDVRTDDEAYNFLMSWVAAQRFARKARRFIVNTNLNSRSWWLFRWDDEEEEGDEGDETTTASNSTKKKKPLCYTPTFGSHFFWYNGRILIFRRNQNRESGPFLIASEREEISICCFGRDPSILKDLLLEAREHYMKRDEKKTLIYRGTIGKASSPDPSWQRCMARTARPFSTVILNEKVKNDLIDDVTDYLNPATRRWYANRGIPYRRGYLLYGPPGTGKSSLSLALAGYFKMKIYIVSLSSVTANEENLASLFAELPRRCVVLLEDIDTAGLTHTRDENKVVEESAGDDMVPGQVTRGAPAPNQGGRLSLSGLLNILDGVASQEGRVLIMTTNHLEKLDKALIRPGRVDMIVKFDKADREMIAAIFRAIFAPLEGDEAPSVPSEKAVVDREAEMQKAETEKKKREEIVSHINELAEKFADNIPGHEFSPAELQGFLLKNKRDPEGAVAGAEQWVVEARKEKQEKELREAEEKRKAEEDEKKKVEEDKKKVEEDKKKEEKEKRRRDKKEAKKKSKKKSKKDGESSDSSGASSDSDSGSASEAEAESEKSEKKSSKKKRKEKKSKKDASSSESSDSEAEAEKDAAKKKENPSEVVVVEKPHKLETTDDKLKVKVDESKTGADSGYGTP